MAYHSDPGHRNSNQNLGAESEETDIAGGEFGLGDHIDCGVDIAAEGLDTTGPCPIGRDEGLSEGFEEFGKSEDGAAEGKLEANEVDGEQGGLLRGFHDRRNRQTDRGNGGIDEDEEGDVADKGAAELPEELHEHGHPE